MSRTACTEPQCLYKGALYLTVELYLYSSYGPYGLYRASVPVQGCTLPYSRAIPLFPLWAVRPVQSLSASTRVHFSFYLPHREQGLLALERSLSHCCVGKESLMRTALLWVIAQRVVVISYRRKKLPRIPTVALGFWTSEDRTDRFPRNVRKLLPPLAT